MRDHAGAIQQGYMKFRQSVGRAEGRYHHWHAAKTPTLLKTQAVFSTSYLHTFPPLVFGQFFDGDRHVVYFVRFCQSPRSTQSLPLLNSSGEAVSSSLEDTGMTEWLFIALMSTDTRRESISGLPSFFAYDGNISNVGEGGESEWWSYFHIAKSCGSRNKHDHSLTRPPPRHASALVVIYGSIFATAVPFSAATLSIGTSHRVIVSHALEKMNNNHINRGPAGERRGRLTFCLSLMTSFVGFRVLYDALLLCRHLNGSVQTQLETPPVARVAVSPTWEGVF